jgi:hypothetical protein
MRTVAFHHAGPLIRDPLTAAEYVISYYFLPIGTLQRSSRGERAKDQLPSPPYLNRGVMGPSLIDNKEELRPPTLAASRAEARLSGVDNCNSLLPKGDVQHARQR